MQQLELHVEGGDIIVTMPGTKYTVARCQRQGEGARLDRVGVQTQRGGGQSDFGLSC